MSDVKVTLDTRGIEERFLKLHKKAQIAMSTQALKDCNKYCKKDNRQLEASSIMHSDYENGILKWQQPYARMQYYLDAARAEGTCKMWAHKAASEHSEDWKLIYEKVFKGGK